MRDLRRIFDKKLQAEEIVLQNKGALTSTGGLFQITTMVEVKDKYDGVRLWETYPHAS